MKYSRQRELILETVMENPVHPTADTVYAMVREQEPNISLGTVYPDMVAPGARGEQEAAAVGGRPDSNLGPNPWCLAPAPPCPHVPTPKALQPR